MSGKDQRIASIDILRGFDLFILLFLQPVLVSIGTVVSAPWYHDLLYQLDHEVWEGFRCWDLVMPLFLFMVGTSMPFSFAKYARKERGEKSVYFRILRRVVILFILGMIVQGNLLGFSIESLKIYNNTLQAIAAGYLIASLILLNCSFRIQILLTFALLIIYSIPMAIYGDYSPEGSFSFRVDEIIIGRFRGDLTYTWIWSSLTFGATVMFGAIAGHLIKNSRKFSKNRVGTILSVCGVALIFLGWILGFYEPIIKRIWTSSMTLFSAGWCFLLMAVFYWWVDILHHHRGLSWLKIYGMNAITAYCLGEVINFRSVVHSLTFGLQDIVNDWYPVILTFGNCVMLFIILWVMYRSRLFVKV